ncbi:MAG: 3D domain-containing protein [Patescibacteria group bacterium]|nr:3D domain-containing protein [Patescibacteria group bacterium]
MIKKSIKNHNKRLILLVIQTLILLVVFGVVSQVYSAIGQNKDTSDLVVIPNFIVVQNNSLTSLSNPANPPPKVVKKLPVIITAYSSTVSQTDDTPFITASGSYVRDGIVANNLLPFGTRIRIPDVYGDKIFTVEDRMHRRKGNYHIDIWYADYWQAKSFGAKRAIIEVLES